MISAWLKQERFYAVRNVGSHVLKTLWNYLIFLNNSTNNNEAIYSVFLERLPAVKIRNNKILHVSYLRPFVFLVDCIKFNNKIEELNEHCSDLFILFIQFKGILSPHKKNDIRSR